MNTALNSIESIPTKTEKLDEFGLSKNDYIQFLKFVKPVKRRTRRAKALQSFC